MQTGEQEVEIGSVAFRGDAFVFESLPVFQFGIEVFDYYFGFRVGHYDIWHE
jgi:hypothetical protein